jgi:trehalose-phosphatase
MKILEPGYDLDRFFTTMSVASQRVLLLDYDGTLAPFRVARDQAVPYPGVRDLLDAILAAQHTRVVVISGRAIADLIPLLGLARVPEIWGTHGWERRWPDGTHEVAALHPAAAQGLVQARAWAEAQGLADRCEPKVASFALHWRGLAPEAIEALRAQVLAEWSPLAQATGLAAHEFDGGIELRIPGCDKGVAARTILAEVGTGAAIAYLGDDLTDEDAFSVIKGTGLGVLVRAELRPTAAVVWLQPPDELLTFLDRWHRTATVARCSETANQTG